MEIIIGIGFIVIAILILVIIVGALLGFSSGEGHIK